MDEENILLHLNVLLKDPKGRKGLAFVRLRSRSTWLAHHTDIRSHCEFQQLSWLAHSDASQPDFLIFECREESAMYRYIISMLKHEYCVASTGVRKGF